MVPLTVPGPASTVWNPVTEAVGLVPRSPVITVRPVFVTPAPARTPNPDVEASATGDGPLAGPPPAPSWLTPSGLSSQHPAKTTASTDAANHETLPIRIMDPSYVAARLCVHNGRLRVQRSCTLLPMRSRERGETYRGTPQSIGDRQEGCQRQES